MNISGGFTPRSETPAPPTPGTCAGGGSSRPSSAPSSSRHPNYGRLSGVTREVLEPLWLNTRIPSREIGKHLGVCVSSVCDHAQKLGLGPRPRRGASLPVRQRGAEFTKMWNAGVKIADIAEHFGLSKNKAQRLRTRLGLEPRKPRKGAGGRAGFGGITLEQFQEQELGRLMAAAAKGNEHV